MILDPTTVDEKTQAPAFEMPVPFLSAELLEFGYVPDSRLLRPGDLLFTEPLKPDSASQAIQSYQSKVYSRGANWTHVAIYIADWQIIHCSPWKAVHSDTLLRFTLSHRIKARRLQIISLAEPLKAENMGLLVCLQAALRIKNSKYDYMSAARTRLEILKTKANFRPGSSLNTPYLYMCSTLYAKSVLDALGIDLHSKHLSEMNFTVTPQMLNNSNLMEDIPLNWAKLSSDSE
jgi:hypothetical protein